MNKLKLLIGLCCGLWILAASFSACDSRQTGEAGIVPPTDSVLLPDTTADDSLFSEETEETSAAVDELFDDFIYSFMKNKKFQLSRIKFPLTQTENGKMTRTNRNAWKHNPLFSESDCYTMIFNDEASIENEKDTSLTEVCVEQIFTSEGKIKHHRFNKLSGHWRLTEIDTRHFATDANHDFLVFYSNFATDSVFQRQHTQNPLRFRTYDPDNFSNVDGLLDIEQWFAFRPELPSDNITNINYGAAMPETKQRILVISSQSAGMNCTLTFVRYGDTWRLVRFEN